MQNSAMVSVVIVLKNIIQIWIFMMIMKLKINHSISNNHGVL